MKLLTMQLSPSILLHSSPFSEIPSFCVIPLGKWTRFHTEEEMIDFKVW